MKTIDDKVEGGGVAKKSKKPFYADYSEHFLCIIAAEFADILSKKNFPCPFGYNPEFVNVYNKLCSAFKSIEEYAKNNMDDNTVLTSEEKEFLDKLREIRVKHKLKVYDKKENGNC